MRDSFIFYRSFYEALIELENDDKLAVYEAIADYSLNQNLTELKGVAKAIFTLIKPQLDANSIRYENGKKGGRPKTKTKPKRNRNETKLKPNVNVNDNVNVNENDNVNKNVYKNIIDYLNLKTNKNYRYTTKKTQDLITARINEGFNLEDFKIVIDKKIQDQYFIENDYLRPETLFSNKFESYLNQNVKKVKTAEDKSNNLKELMKYR